MSVAVFLGSKSSNPSENGRVQISQILVFPNDDSHNRHKAKKKRRRLREFFVDKGELLAIEEGIKES